MSPILFVANDNVTQKRTIRPLYADHQATPLGVRLSSTWDRSKDILPGMVTCKLSGENFTLYTGAGSQKPTGLSALFVAPVLGIDEVRKTGTNVFAVWEGGPDAVFEILAPAYAASATWTQPGDGTRVLLGATKSAHADGPGKLAPHGTNVSTEDVGELWDVVGTKIIVRLFRVAN